ncbi:MAG: alpha-hydroxy-acid oxidizing protein, partial [Acidobacteriota bacterium]|nr:alpha-hydroxy-acid oxidizing protein [Acidobacteriota bacterium]
QGPPAAIANPKEAINVMDFEAAARQALPPAHYGYLATGVDDDATLRANREGFSRIQLRPRRLVDITHVDTRIELFGTTWESPIGLCPIGNQKAFHPEGELPVARAARDRNILQILSTAANSSVEEVSKILGRPVWYQLYPTSRWEITEKLVKRAEAAGCPALVLTIDTQAGRHTETLDRFKRLDSRKCGDCHGAKSSDFFRRKPMLDLIDMSGIGTANPAFSWEHVRRLKRLTPMKLLIKGIETHEDASLCLQNGVDGVVVSNHGGRAEESGRGTIECLPEIVEAVGGRIPVLIDGGFRRGTDVFKALALGARAVCIGRPYIWGLAAFGQPGVERVIDILRLELELVMKQCGATSIPQIGRNFVMARA